MDSHLVVREELLAVEEDRMRGSKGYSVDEVAAMMRNAIKEGAEVTWQIFYRYLI